MINKTMTTMACFCYGNKRRSFAYLSSLFVNLQMPNHVAISL